MSDIIKAEVIIEANTDGAEAAIDVLNQMKALAGSTGDVLSKTANSAGELGAQFYAVGEETAGFSKALTALGGPASDMIAVIPEVASSLEEMQPSVEGVTTSIQELNRPLNATAQLLENASPPMAQLTEHASTLADALPATTQGFVQVQEAVTRTIPLLPQYAESMKAVSVGAGELAPVFDQVQANVSALDGMLSSSTPFSDMKGFLASTGQSFNDLSATVNPEKLTAFFDRIDQTAQQGTPAVTAYGEAVNTVGQAFTDSGQAAEVFQKNSEAFNQLAATYGSPQEMQKAFAQAGMSDVYNNMVQQQQSFASAAQQVGEIVSEITLPPLEELAPAFVASGNAAQGATKPLDSLAPTIAAGGNAAQEAIKPLDTLQASLVNAGDSSTKFSGQFTTSLANAQKGINSFGGVGNSQYGPELSAHDSLNNMLGGIGSSALDMVNQIAMPLMVAQQIAAIATQVGQGIYEGAVTQEGAAAHSVGSFTGAVDALGQTQQRVSDQMAEGVGKQMIPSLDAMNSKLSESTDASNGWAKALGGAADFASNLALVVGGVTPGISALPGVGPGMVDAGLRGFQNEWAQSQGQPLPYTGPNATTTVDLPKIQQQLAQATAQMNAQANDPAYLAANALLSYNSAQAQIAQQSWQDSHYTGTTGPTDPNNNLYQGEAVRASGQSYGYSNAAKQDPNADYFYGLLGQTPYTNESAYGTTGGGCFPAGTRVLCLDGTERPIEGLRVGDIVAAHDGTEHIAATILACISYLNKQTYELRFSNGNSLVLTDSHPIATINGWKSLSPDASKLENPDLYVLPLHTGDRVYITDGSLVTLHAIMPRAIVTVHNITVSGTHTYYANGILVHNGKLSALSPSTADSSGAITKNVPITVTWSLVGDLVKNSIQNSGWGLMGQLAQNSIQNSGWGLMGELAKSSIQNSGWGLMGQLMQTSIQNSGWGLMGQLAQNSIQASTWGLSGELNKQWQGAVTWATTGTLDKTFQGDVKWTADNLEHTFLGQPTWVATNLNPVFQVAATFLGLATGVIDNPQAQIAMVGENGPELMYVPQGASVFPNGVNPLATGVGGIGSGAPSTMIGSGGGGGGPITLQIYIDSIMLAQSILPQIAPLMRVNFGVRR